MSGYSYAIIAVIVGSVGQIILKIGTTSYPGSIANDFFSSFLVF